MGQVTNTVEAVRVFNSEPSFEALERVRRYARREGIEDLHPVGADVRIGGGLTAQLAELATLHGFELVEDLVEVPEMESDYFVESPTLNRAGFLLDVHACKMEGIMYASNHIGRSNPSKGIFFFGGFLNVEGEALEKALRDSDTQAELYEFCLRAARYIDAGHHYPGCVRLETPAGSGAWRCDCDMEFSFEVEGLEEQFRKIAEDLPRVSSLSDVLESYAYAVDPIALSLAKVIVEADGDADRLKALMDEWREADKGDGLWHAFELEDHACDILGEWLDDNEEDALDEDADEFERAEAELIRKAFDMIQG